MKLRLQIIVSPRFSFPFEYSGTALRIGRNPEGELVLEGEAGQCVSWNHARIELTPRQATLTDLESTNGTFVNDRRVTARSPLDVGDQIQMGHTGPTLKVVELDLSESAPTQPPPSALAHAGAAPPIKQSPPRRAAEELIPQTLEVSLEKDPNHAIRPAATHGEPATEQNTQRYVLLAAAGVGISVALLVGVVLWKSRSTREVAQRAAAVSQDVSDRAPAETVRVALPESAEQPTALPAKRSGGEPAAVVKSARTKKPPVEKATAADDPALDAPNADRREVGTYLAPDKGPPSVLLQRQREPYPWAPLRPGSRVSTANYLVSLPGYRSQILLDSAAQLTLWGNVPEFSNFPPVLESAVMLNAPAPGVDLDLTLDHGRVHVANNKPAGEARVRIRFHREIWDLALPDAGSEAVLELWGLYPPDVPFSKEPGGKGPLACLGLFVKGQARLKTPRQEYQLPNLSQVIWSNANPNAVDLQTLKQLPEWWTNKIEPRKPEVAEMMLTLKDLSTLINKTDAVVDALSTQVRESSDLPTQLVGILFLGAVDSVQSLVDALEDRQHAEVRAMVAQALRHWISRSGDNDLELYRLLHEKKGYSREKAEIIMRLLHSFSKEAIAKPETYETLIAYLSHENLAIRGLAYWHLTLLAPDGAKKIPYDPAGDAEQRKRACAEWKKLIPSGAVLPTATGTQAN